TGDEKWIHYDNPKRRKSWGKPGKVFLHRIVTGDEKWIHYDNPKRRKSWGKPGHASTSSLYLVGSAGCNLL
ncbi:MOS1T transposase, partial [Pseudoatta argentina]